MKKTIEADKVYQSMITYIKENKNSFDKETLIFLIGRLSSDIQDTKNFDLIDDFNNLIKSIDYDNYNEKYMRIQWNSFMNLTH